MRAKTIYEFQKSGNVKSSLGIGKFAFRKKVEGSLDDLKNYCIKKVDPKFIMDFLWSNDNNTVIILFIFREPNSSYANSEIFYSFVNELYNEDMGKIEISVNAFSKTIKEYESFRFDKYNSIGKTIRERFPSSSIENIEKWDNIYEWGDGGIIIIEFGDL